MGQLGQASTKSSTSNGDSEGKFKHFFGPTPGASSLETTPSVGTLSHDTPDYGVPDVNSSFSNEQHEGESSLLSHVVFARQFLQNAVDKTTEVEAARDMQEVLDGLRAAVHSGKQHADTLASLYPHAKPVFPGMTTRNLPLPPMEKVFTCLRLAKESPHVATLWLGDYMKPSQFSDYFIKVASSGSATESDLIIVHCGLYWLFCECSKAAANQSTKQDYDAQALKCSENLETVLSNLRFHQPTNLDFAYAMGMAVSS